VCYLSIYLGELDGQYHLHLSGNLRLCRIQIRSSAPHWLALTLRCLHLYFQACLMCLCPFCIKYMTSASLVYCNVLYCIIDFKHLVYFAIFLGSIAILRSPINWSRVLFRDMFTNYLRISYKPFTWFFNNLLKTRLHCDPSSCILMPCFIINTKKAAMRNDGMERTCFLVIVSSWTCVFTWF